MKIAVNKKHLISLLIILLMLMVPVFGLNVLDQFNNGLKKISDKFYDREDNTVTGENILNLNSCTDSNTLFKLSSSTNAHAAVYTDTAYTFRACTGNLVISDRNCNADGSNVIIKLSSSTNAHVEKPTQNSYNVKVCSSDLTCNYRSSCNSDEQCVVSISSDTNAHVGDCVGGYNLKLCCKASSCSVRSCELDVCNTKNTCQTGGCLWDNTNSKCCPPGKIYDTSSGKCIYDPNGNNIDLICTTQEEKFVFNNKLCIIKLNSVTNGNANMVVSCDGVGLATPSLTSVQPSNIVDVDLNGDNVPDLRIKLNSISSNSCKGSFTYLVNDLGTGLCKSSDCSAQSTDPNSICNKGFGYCTIGTTCNYYQPNKKYPDSACCEDGKRWDAVRKKCENFQISGRCSAFGEFDSNAETTCCQASSTTGFWFPIRIY